MGFSIQAQSKTASQVFEQASASVVVVHGLDAKGKQQSLGSGVVLPGGEVATNCHVIKDARQYRVKFLGKLYEARTRHTDWDRDVCTLTANGLKVPAVILGSTKELKVGAKVYAIGAPHGLELSLSEGIVSNLRDVDGGRYIQTTAPISPGSSGGGLFDEEGRLLGLPSFYLAEGQQINFAVPVEWLRELPKRHIVRRTSQTTFAEWLNMALSLQEAKNWPDALRHAQRWTKTMPDSGFAWFHLGYVYAETGHSVKAIEAYQRALRIVPDGAEAWNNLGIAYEESGQSVKAINAYEQALRIDPEHANTWYNLGVAYNESGQSVKAIKAYEQAVRIDPEHAKAWNNLGNAFVASKQSAKAIESFKQALRIDPEDAKAWNNLGVTYYISGQRTQVIDVYRRLQPLDKALAEKFFTNFVIP
jgi:Flp pilus assembly protein TadD